jgi:hypothetical protein
MNQNHPTAATAENSLRERWFRVVFGRDTVAGRAKILQKIEYV